MEQNKKLLLKYLLSSINLDCASDMEQLRTQGKNIDWWDFYSPRCNSCVTKRRGQKLAFLGLHIWILLCSSHPLWEKAWERRKRGEEPGQVMPHPPPGRELLPDLISHLQLAPGCEESPTSGFCRVLLLIQALRDGQESCRVCKSGNGRRREWELPQFERLGLIIMALGRDLKYHLFKLISTLTAFSARRFHPGEPGKGNFSTFPWVLPISPWKMNQEQLQSQTLLIASRAEGRNQLCWDGALAQGWDFCQNSRAEDKEPPGFESKKNLHEKWKRSRRRWSCQSYLGHEETQQARKMWGGNSEDLCLIHHLVCVWVAASCWGQEGHRDTPGHQSGVPFNIPFFLIFWDHLDQWSNKPSSVLQIHTRTHGRRNWKGWDIWDFLWCWEVNFKRGIKGKIERKRKAK